MKSEEIKVWKMIIDISNRKEKFVATTEDIIFNGYKILYITNNVKKENALNKYKNGDNLDLSKIITTEKYTKNEGRFSEATLINKMEKLGIGRPSTYASIINIIQERKYVEKKNMKGNEVEIEIFTLDKIKNLTITKQKIFLENEKNKLIPTKIGIKVNTYLVENFDNIFEYNFTASIEKELDKISLGECDNIKMIENIYNSFHPIVEKLYKSTNTINTEKRYVGIDKESNRKIYAYKAKYGPVIQIGDNNDDDKNIYLFKINIQLII